MTCFLLRHQFLKQPAVQALPAFLWPYLLNFTVGTGLGYTTFSFSDLKVNSSTFGPDSPVQVSVKVKNAGKRAGKKAVEFYSFDQYASITPGGSAPSQKFHWSQARRRK